ncbi:MAG: carboxylesterase family protein [Myxococcales bacterium]|nr:carboxylesterase family protein [Myxococcales bacterium]
MSKLLGCCGGRLLSVAWIVLLGCGGSGAADSTTTTSTTDTGEASTAASADDTLGPPTGTTDGPGTTGVDGGSTRGSESEGSGSSTGEEPPEPLDLPPADPPVPVPPGTLHSVDIPCGPYPETAFDVFLPPSDQPTPMVVFIHGGGFTGGDKSAAYGGQTALEITALLEAGVAFATIDYRLLQTVDDEGVIKPLGDSRYCLQFMRYHAASLNLDEARIGAYGGSAGAGTSLWLGTHDDMADPGSPDPVERRSTRLRAVGLRETQATYDVIRWLDEIFAPYGITLDMIIMAGLEQRLLSFYGIDSIAELDTPPIVAYRDDVDMLDLMDGSDAPIWIHSQNQPEAFPTDTGSLFHHPYHAQAVMEEALAKGVEQVSYIPVLGIEDPSGETLVEFMLRHLEVR